MINGKRIPTRWECSTQADDPLTFTKTWTSDEVPGGLVRTQQQTHTQITGETYRDISQTLYAPIEGVEPQLGDGATPAPSAAGSPARPPAAAVSAQPAPVRGRQEASATSAAGQPEFMTHYGAVMRRAAQTRFAFGPGSKEIIRSRRAASGRYPRRPGAPAQPATGGESGDSHARLSGGRAKPSRDGGHTGGHRGFPGESRHNRQPRQSRAAMTCA